MADGIFILTNYFKTREMKGKLALNQGGISFADVFTQYLSDITLEVEAMKLRSLKNDVDSVNEHLARIENALWQITNAKLALAEKINHSSN
ncbi:MAG: hypothetical protein WA799_06150 [Nitrosotalea sp.]